MSATPILLTALAAVLLVVGLASVAASQPPFSLAQYGGASNDRELCLQNCREWVTPFAWGWRRGGGYNYQYARCVQDCESRFWKDFDRKMEQLEDN